VSRARKKFFFAFLLRTNSENSFVCFFCLCCKHFERKCKQTLFSGKKGHKKRIGSRRKCSLVMNWTTLKETRQYKLEKRVTVLIDFGDEKNKLTLKQGENFLQKSYVESFLQKFFVYYIIRRNLRKRFTIEPEVWNYSFRIIRKAWLYSAKQVCC